MIELQLIYSYDCDLQGFYITYKMFKSICKKLKKNYFLIKKLNKIDKYNIGLKLLTHFS